MVKEIRHTGIVVSDIDKSIHFYGDLLGFKVCKDMIESGDYIDNFSCLTVTPLFPIAIAILPQLGSSPNIAVLTNGELAIENDIFFASLSLEHFRELIFINFEAPSPSLTTLFAKFNKTLFRAKSKSLSFISVSYTHLTLPTNREV